MGDGDRLRWRCRRGMRELDVMLTRYLDEYYAESAVDEQAAFRGLLEEADPELLLLLMGRSEARNDAEQSVLRRMRAGS